MTNVISKTGNLRKPSIIGSSHNRNRAGASSVKDDPFEYTAPCPICDKRTLDVSGLPESMVMLRYKCPHCRNIVVIYLTAEDIDDMEPIGET